MASGDYSDSGVKRANQAGILLLTAGLLGLIQGLAGIAKSSYYHAPDNYFITTSGTTWGWWLVIVGLVVGAAGVAIFAKVSWALWPATIVVIVQLITNFLFIPYQLAWSLVLIVVDLLVINALFTRHDHRDYGDFDEARAARPGQV